MPLRNLSASAGSSPLTRGKRLAGCVVPHVVRLIPAHAGKTSGQPSTRHPRAAHPRSRGENDGSRLALRRIVGSSPLTRGKRRSCHRVSWRGGLIPAHAGKTRHASMRFEVVAGSSPLTRGKRFEGGEDRCPKGLIPAHAGKTRSPARRRTAWPAHPRSRGENPLGMLRAFRLRGSSPLTRGKPDPDSHAAVKRGLIPAHAGKTWSLTARSVLRTAHPRSRGENPNAASNFSAAGGSSPLTRGKLV